MNASTTSLSAGAATAEQREVLRTASSLLIREMVRVGSASGSGFRDNGKDKDTGAAVGAAVDYEEVERRLAALVRLERVWGRSGAMSSSTNLGSGSASGSGFLAAGGQGAGGSTTISAAGEERERRYFSEGLRDGYVLCQYVSLFVWFFFQFWFAVLGWALVLVRLV